MFIIADSDVILESNNALSVAGGIGGDGGDANSGGGGGGGGGIILIRSILYVDNGATLDTGGGVGGIFGLAAQQFSEFISVSHITLVESEVVLDQCFTKTLHSDEITIIFCLISHFFSSFL